jgi:hypothetical protein
MEIEDIDVDTLVDANSHGRKAFRSETVELGGIRTGMPFNAGEIRPRVDRERIQPASNSRAARCRGSVRVLVVRVEHRMIIEILCGSQLLRKQILECANGGGI